MRIIDYGSYKQPSNWEWIQLFVFGAIVVMLATNEWWVFVPLGAMLGGLATAAARHTAPHLFGKRSDYPKKKFARSPKSRNYLRRKEVENEKTRSN
jgi:hypothetical protein